GSATSSGGGPLIHARAPIGDVVTLDGGATLIFDGAHSPVLDVAADASFRLDSLTSFTVRGSRVHAHPNMDGSWMDGFILGYQLPARAPTLSGAGVTLAHRLVPYASATIELRGEKVSNWAGLSHPSISQLDSPADAFLHDGS